MKIEDVNLFKGKMKTAVQRWAEVKIDELFADSAMARMFVKNGLNNALNRFDSRMNEGIDHLFLFVSKDGTVDTDTMIEGIAQLFDEMKPCEYEVGAFRVTMGNGELAVELPKNFLFDMLVGCGRLRFTSEDVLEFKNLF